MRLAIFVDGYYFEGGSQKNPIDSETYRQVTL